MKSTDDLAGLSKMSAKMGAKTRGIIELTGKTSLRAFKGAVNIMRWLFEWVWTLGVAAVGWAFFAARRMVFRRRRAAA